jgi:hypothetical protein
MKLAGAILLGIIASVFIGVFLSVIAEEVMPSHGEAEFLIQRTFIVSLISFFAGSIVTGYFCYYALEHKRNLVWMPPGLYSVWLMLMQVEGGKGIWLFFLMCLLWYLSSLAGVAAGYFLRYKIICWWYGFDEKGQIVRPFKADDKAEFQQPMRSCRKQEN